MEATLALIKPDGIAHKQVGKIISMIEEEGLLIAGMKMVKLNGFQASAFYGVHKDKEFFKDLVEFMVSGPCIAMILVGENSVERWRKLMGATDPAEAEEGTIRAMFGSKDVVRFNVVHGSDSLKAASFEIRYFFNGLEI